MPDVPATAIQFKPFLFVGYQKPFGFLSPKREAHGLMFYALQARRVYEDNELGNRIELETQLSQQPNYRRLFESVAMMYGVSPDSMSKYWDEVDMQFVALKLPQLPKLEKYRFNQTIIVN